MNWFKKKVFEWVLKFLKGKIRGAGTEINELYENLYILSMNEFMAWCMNKISKRNLNTISFPSYLKEINDPLRDDIEEWIDGAIDGLDPREK